MLHVYGVAAVVSFGLLQVLGAGSTARLDVPHMQIIFVDLIIHYSMDPSTR